MTEEMPTIWIDAFFITCITVNYDENTKRTFHLFIVFLLLFYISDLAAKDKQTTSDLKKVAGSISMISAEDMNPRPVANESNVLQGMFSEITYDC